MAAFFDAPIQEDHFLVNAPNCRIRREGSLHYLRHTQFSEPQLPGYAPSEVLHEIAHPFSIGLVIYRRVVLHKDGVVRKSVRISQSNLGAEKRSLELVKAKTSVPVPNVRQHYMSTEFEHLIRNKMPGMTLEAAWPTMYHSKRESIADQVVSLVQQLRELRSPNIHAALLRRQPLRAGPKDATKFNMESIRPYLSNEHIVAYVHERSMAITGQSNVFRHGDLDWSNIIIPDDGVCGIINLESSRFFPPYWVWLTVKRLSQGLPDGSWFQLLDKRLAQEAGIGWEGMWEVEQLIMALDQFSQWALSPAAREINRGSGWAKVTAILGAGVGGPPPVTYAMALEHPWWLESVSQFPDPKIRKEE